MNAYLYFDNPSINYVFSAHSSLFENFYQTKKPASTYNTLKLALSNILQMNNM